jgi:heptosyltransferase II
MAEKTKKKKKSRAKRWRAGVKSGGYLFVYGFYRLVGFILQLLPLSVVWRLGRGLGWIVRLFLPRYRQLVRQNIDLALADTMSEPERKKLAAAHFQTLGANLLCALKVPTMTKGQIQAAVSFDGLENLDHAQAGLFAIAHMGCWEFLSQIDEIAVGAKGGTLYQALANPWLNRHIEKQRGRFGYQLFDRTQGFHAPVQHLRQAGHMLGVLIDQHAGDGGVWCPLFGRLASTTNLAGLIALRTQTPIYPLGIMTTGPARWKIIIRPAIAPQRDIDGLTAVLNQQLEQLIRLSPADWFWVHNRWKTPRPNFLLSQYKRGIAMPAGMSVESLKPFEIIVRSPNWLGDACMALPLIRALKFGRPDARVTVLTNENLQPLWAAVSEVDEIIPRPKKANAWATARLIKATGRRYDVGVLLPNSLRSALELWLAGVPRRVGFAGHHRRWLLNQIIPAPEPGPIRHQLEDGLDLVRTLGAKTDDPRIHQPIRLSGTPVASAGFRLGLCLGAEYGSAKRWPSERFAAVAQQMQQQYPELTWVLLGVEKEKALAAEVRAALTGPCEDLVGQTTLTQLMQELTRCQLLLTNDTGTMHLAAVLGVPTVALFGSTEPARTGPLAMMSEKPISHEIIRHHVECSPCFLRECPRDFRCMKAISVDEVTSRLKSLLAI